MVRSSLAILFYLPKVLDSAACLAQDLVDSSKQQKQKGFMVPHKTLLKTLIVLLPRKKENMSHLWAIIFSAPI
jgi:hypothetical protein